MKLNPTPQALRALFTKKPRSRLPGEPRDFIPKKPKDSLCNLTPPQHLTPEGTITSTRDHEVSTRDHLWDRVEQLKTAIKEALDTLPTKGPLDDNTLCDILWIRERLTTTLNRGTKA